MAYKIKSMLKQTSGTGLSANYYLKQELNKFTDGDLNVMKPSNKGKSIAKVTEKFTTPKLIKAKDTARERDEKKQIIRAGREAAKNAEIDFVKATPMGSDYFSLMAATAENIASRAGQRRKAKKAAKEMKREMLSEARDIKRLEKKKPSSIVESVRSKVNDTKLPKKDTKVAPFNWTYEGTQKQGEPEKKKEVFGDDINKKFIERITDYSKGGSSDNKKTESLDSRYYYKDGTPKYSVKTNPKTGEEYTQRNPSPASRAVGEKLKNISESIVSDFKNPFSDEAIAARKAKLEQARQEREQRQEERELDLEKIKQIQGLPMMGDGFNKGMSRKNKYKK